MLCSTVGLHTVCLLQGFKDLSVEARYKTWTCGEDNTITLGCFEARPEDEGDYKASNDDFLSRTSGMFYLFYFYLLRFFIVVAVLK